MFDWGNRHVFVSSTLDGSDNLGEYWPEPDIPRTITVNFYGCDDDCKGCSSKYKSIVWLNGANCAMYPNTETKRKCIVFKKHKDEEGFYKWLLKETSARNTKKVILSGGEPLNPKNIGFVKRVLEINEKNNHFLSIFILTSHSQNEVLYELKDVKGFDFVKFGKYNKSYDRPFKRTNEFIRWSTQQQGLLDKDLNLLSDQDGYYYF